MPDYLSSILAQEQARQTKRNPFLNTASALQGGIPYVPQADWRYNLAAGLLGPLAGGAFQGIGENQVTQNLSNFGQQLHQYSEKPDLGSLPEALQRYRPTLEMQEISDDRQLAQQTGLLKNRYDAFYGKTDPEAKTYAQDMLDGTISKEDEANYQLSYPRHHNQTLRSLKAKQVKDRSDRSYDYKVDLGEIGGWKTTTGKPLAQGEAKEIRTKLEALAQLTAKYDFIASQPADSVLGTEARVSAGVRGEMFNIWRLLTNSGARLEGPEKKFIQGMLASNFRGDPLNWMANVGLGSDPREFARIMSGLVQKHSRIGLLGRGLYNPAWGFDDMPIKHLVDAAYKSRDVQDYLNSLDITQFDPNDSEGMAALEHLRRYDQMLKTVGTGLGE